MAAGSTAARLGSTAIVALLAGFGGAALWSISGFGDHHTRDYLVANPEILPQMAEALQAGEAERQLAEIGPSLQQPFPGAVIGNPNGSRTLIKFTDYACGYCKASVADVERLVTADPDLKVIIREWPIFDGSEPAARMSLAAAEQGKYDAFYHAMFAYGPPSEDSIEQAARSAGLDMARARRVAGSSAVSREIASNMALAQRLGFSGTPSWVAGDTVIEGAVGYDRLRNALEANGPG